MIASEIRIGNLVFSIETNSNEKIVGITEEHPYLDTITFDYSNYDEIEQIPLTEEWLEKFGFVKNSLNIFCKDDILVVNGFEVILGKIIVKIENVHSLQNLYFALTGKELVKVDKYLID